MIKNLLFSGALLFVIKLISAQDHLLPYQPVSSELHAKITQLDSVLFDAYNTCKVEVFAHLVHADIEFYHDLGGFSNSKPELVAAIKNNICGKTERQLLKGSIEVYPIPGYGAVQMGVHRFHNIKEDSTGNYAKFVHIWRQIENEWFLARVVSLH